MLELATLFCTIVLRFTCIFFVHTFDSSRRITLYVFNFAPLPKLCETILGSFRTRRHNTNPTVLKFAKRLQRPARQHAPSTAVISACMKKLLNLRRIAVNSLPRRRRAGAPDKVLDLVHELLATLLEDDIPPHKPTSIPQPDQLERARQHRYCVDGPHDRVQNRQRDDCRQPVARQLAVVCEARAMRASVSGSTPAGV